MRVVSVVTSVERNQCRGGVLTCDAQPEASDEIALWLADEFTQVRMRWWVRLDICQTNRLKAAR